MERHYKLSQSTCMHPAGAKVEAEADAYFHTDAVQAAGKVVIDVRKKQGDLLTWLGQQLPSGLLLIDTQALENPNNAKSYNARVGNAQAVFVYAPAHGKLAAAAELHTGDNQYFYQVTYLGGTPDNLDNRTAFLHVLNTLTLTGTTASGMTLPTTAFITGIDPARWK